MGPVIAIVIALFVFLLLTRMFVLSVLRRVNVVRTVGVDQAVAGADGGSVIIGENHSDREGLRLIVALMAAAHERGYRTLGVEVCWESSGSYRGLTEELELLRGPESGSLTEHDDRSYLDADASGVKPRMNRHWYMRAALQLGWNVIPIDPHHWNWVQETADGYLDSREPAMAEAIRSQGPMIAVCGYGHLRGLHAQLGPTATYVVASAVRLEDTDGHPMWAEPIAFAATLPRLEL